GGAGGRTWTVFISSAIYNGNLGGLAGADQKCQQLAAAAGMGINRKFMAWLSTSTVSAASRLYHAPDPYVLVSEGGEVVASNWADLTDGTLQRSIQRDELGRRAGPDSGASVWTGTSRTGATYLSFCGEWMLFAGTNGAY